jgi:hypothetical protein
MTLEDGLLGALGGVRWWTGGRMVEKFGETGGGENNLLGYGYGW